MTPEQQKSILAIALFAAFADGNKDDREREEIRRIADSLSNEASAIDLPRLYQDVLLKRLSLNTACATLNDEGMRQFAYEMAVCVCEADGHIGDTERDFLNELKQSLQIGSTQTNAIEGELNPVIGMADLAAPATVANAQGTSGTPAPQQAKVANVSSAELDKSILNYALLNGALELLPQSWASMAIIPLQIKMVYGVGKAHGVELDQGHIKEFIAAAGVGLTSQYLEQFGRKLLGGLLGKAAGKAFGKLGSTATGMAFSFATTYALGQVAKSYYASGRTMSTALLRETFESLLGPAKQMQAQYLPQIQQKASTLDMSQVMSMIKGN
jgi:uncharacterized protein (DUF697 family)/tellurite resistance protein